MKVLVVDDEPVARRRLVRMLEALADVEVAGEAGDGIAALEAIERERPDAVLLDIRMPGMDGLALAASDADLPPIVFTTAYDEYAVQAFDVEAVDYLLKPVRRDRLEAALEKVRARREAVDARSLRSLLERVARPAGEADVPRVTARAGASVRVFDPREIGRFHASEKYTLFHRGDREFVLDETLAALERRLGPLGFLRIHRSELVNLAHVRALHADEGGTRVELADGQTAPVSRRFRGELERRLGIRS